MKPTSVSFLYSARLGVKGAPHVHEELTRRLGTPDTCFDEPADKCRALWEIRSPISEHADIKEHFAWAASVVEQHSDFLRDLVAAGVRVELQLSCITNIDYKTFDLEAVLFRPFVQIGIAIGFYVGLNEDGERGAAIHGNC